MINLIDRSILRKLFRELREDTLRFRMSSTTVMPRYLGSRRATRLIGSIRLLGVALWDLYDCKVIERRFALWEAQMVLAETGPLGAHDAEFAESVRGIYHFRGGCANGSRYSRHLASYLRLAGYKEG